MTTEPNTTTAQQSGPSVPFDVIIAGMRNWAGVAESCAITEGHAPSCIRTWADLLEPYARQLQAAGGEDWFAECRRCLEDISTEMRATGRGDERFQRLLSFMPRQHIAPPAGGFVVDGVPTERIMQKCDPSVADYIGDKRGSFTVGFQEGVKAVCAASPTAQPSAKDGVRGEEGCFARGAGLKTCECAKCLALEAEIAAGEIGSRIDILRRICKRGRNYFLGKEDNTGIDLFEHMETEVGWLASTLSKATTASGLADAVKVLRDWRAGENQNTDTFHAAIDTVLAAIGREVGG